MESNREFNSGRLFVAEQLFRLHRAEYEALFGAMPPLDDTTRFPALTPETAGCVEVTTPKGSTFACRGVPGDGADYDGMAPADQTLVTTVAVNGDQGHRRLRARSCAAAPAASIAGSTATRRRSTRSRAARRGAVRRARAAASPATAGPRLTDGAFHNVGLSPAIVAVAIQDLDDRGAATGRRRRAHRSDEHRGRASATAIAARCPAAPGPALEGAFRTPTLRCAASHPSFMHTGADDRARLRSSRSSIAAAIRPGGYPGTNELHALGLTERERADLVAFMGALAGPGPDAGAAGGAMSRSSRGVAAVLPRVGASACSRCAVRAGGAGSGRAVRAPDAGTLPDVPFDHPEVRRRTCRSREPAASTRPRSATPSRAGPSARRPRRRAGSRALERRRAARPTTAPASTTPSASDRRSSAPAAPISRTRASCPTPTCWSAIRPRRSPAATSLATAAAQNYGLATYRIRQPFDFAGRTGTIKLDMDSPTTASAAGPR